MSSILSLTSAILNPLAKYYQQKQAYDADIQQAKATEENLKNQLGFVEKQLEDEYNQKISSIQQQQQNLVQQAQNTQQSYNNSLSYSISQNLLSSSYNKAKLNSDIIQNESVKNYKLATYKQQLKYLYRNALNAQQEYQARLGKLSDDTQSELQALNIKSEYESGQNALNRKMLEYQQKLSKINQEKHQRETASKLKAMFGANGVSMVGSPLAVASSMVNEMNQDIAQSAGMYALKYANIDLQDKYQQQSIQNQQQSILSGANYNATMLGLGYQSQMSSIKHDINDTALSSEYAQNEAEINETNMVNKYFVQQDMLNNENINIYNRNYLQSQALRNSYLYNYNNYNQEMQNLYTNLINAVKSVNSDYNSQMWASSIKQYVWNQAKQNSLINTGIDLTYNLAAL